METDSPKDRLGKLLSAKNTKEVNQVYSEWANKYEDDLLSLGNNKGKSAEFILSVIRNTEQSSLLDVAAGTGLGGNALRDRGYIGGMDAIELNAEMLKIAKSKSLYRHHIQFEVVPDSPLPVEDGSYDTVVCVGGFVPCHLDPGCIDPLIRALKCGGVIFFNVRLTKAFADYRLDLETKVNRLVSLGQLEKFIVEDIQHYSAAKANDTVLAAKMRIFIYRKIVTRIN